MKFDKTVYSILDITKKICQRPDEFIDFSKETGKDQKVINRRCRLS